MFSFRYTSGVCTIRYDTIEEINVRNKKTILSYRMGQKIMLQTLVHIFAKYWWILQIYISQGSAATQLRCSGMLSNHFITNFLQNVPVKFFWKKICQYLANTWTKVCGLLFWPPCIPQQFLVGFQQPRQIVVHCNSVCFSRFLWYYQLVYELIDTWHRMISNSDSTAIQQ